MAPVFDLPPTPAEHFRACLLATVAQVAHAVSRPRGRGKGAPAEHELLESYEEEAAARGFDLTTEGAISWERALEEWEGSTCLHLPLRALRQAAGLDHRAMRLLLCAGLVEEDGRFGAVFESEGGLGRRPTAGLLVEWWREEPDDPGPRSAVHRLLELGLLRALNPDAPRLEWVVEVPGLVWDALRGESPDLLAPWATHRPSSALVDVDDLIPIDGVESPVALAERMAAGDVRALVVRGPDHNGRRAFLGAVARELDRGVLEVRGLLKPDDERWRSLGVLATLLHALPVVAVVPGPGETVELPELPGCDAPVAVVLGRQGGVQGPALAQGIALSLPMPEPATRRRHWAHALGESPELDAITRRFRMTTGNIRRAGALARSCAALDGRTTPGLPDVVRASRTLHRQVFDNLATAVAVSGTWNDLAVGGDTQRELAGLESRCRAREELRDAVGPLLARQLGVGVRALFSGPSGTGKTLAARLLAAVLQMDLYRVDLTIVSKWIGETERNLNQVLSRAEELDVVLLLDEGDALMAPRTGVSTSVDRYANLETNFLLQRLESFEGILVVTTNAPERIDAAFERRMDVVVEFRAPAAVERRAIWEMHLPISHAVTPLVLDDLAERCPISGGQIRNAVLHASLLALDRGRPLGQRDLEEAVRREYRKAGAVCPLRRDSVTAWRA